MLPGHGKGGDRTRSTGRLTPLTASNLLAKRVFADLKMIARESYDRIVGLVLREIAVDGCITKAPGGGECAGPSPVDRRKQGMKRSLLAGGAASRSAGCWPRRTGMTPRCWPPRWANSMTSGRSRMTSPSTSTRATTHRRPATSSPDAA